MSPILDDRRKLDFGKELAESGWYHSMDFPDGQIIEGYSPISVLRQRYAEFGLPSDLEGFRCLDIGAWDGWFSFEMERHGACVTAVDLVEVKNFLYAHERLNSNVKYVISDVYDLRQMNLMPFDYVLFLGVLYHLRHPLLALETVCALTTEMAVIDSYVIDGEENEYVTHPLPYMEFYETDELGANIDNWVGPTVECLKALCRSAGFARVEYVNTWHRHARLRCFRRWEPVPSTCTQSPPVLEDALNSRTYGVNFRSGKEEYLTLWFRSDDEALTRDDLRPEVCGFGVPALSLHRQGTNHWSTNLLMPPGLPPGTCRVRLRLARSDFSNEKYVFNDVPVTSAGLEIRAVHDGTSWTKDVCESGTGRYLVLYVGGLPENTDRTNVQVIAGETMLKPLFVGPKDANGSQQVNVQLPTGIGSGTCVARVRQGDLASSPYAFHIVA